MNTPRTDAAIKAYANAISMRLQQCAKRPTPVYADSMAALEIENNSLAAKLSQLSEQLGPPCICKRPMRREGEGDDAVWICWACESDRYRKAFDAIPPSSARVPSDSTAALRREVEGLKALCESAFHEGWERKSYWPQSEANAAISQSQKL